MKCNVGNMIIFNANCYEKGPNTLLAGDRVLTMDEILARRANVWNHPNLPEFLHNYDLDGWMIIDNEHHRLLDSSIIMH